MEQMVRVELSDEQRELYKAILSKNYEALVGEYKDEMWSEQAVSVPCSSTHQHVFLRPYRTVARFGQVSLLYTVYPRLQTSPRVL